MTKQFVIHYVINNTDDNDTKHDQHGQYRLNATCEDDAFSKMHKLYSGIVFMEVLKVNI